MKEIISKLMVLVLSANTNAADLNVNIAPQMTNYGNAIHTALTVSDFYGKGIFEVGLEKDFGNKKMPNFKAQVIQFLPRDFSASVLMRESDGFVYFQAGPGHSFANGKVNVGLSGQVNIPVQEGKFGSPEFGANAYVGYEPIKGLTVYTIGSTSKSFKMLRGGVRASLPKVYRR